MGMNKTRLDRVIACMKKRGLRRILVSAPKSLFYLTGLNIIPGERLTALTIDESGDCALYVNRLFALTGLNDGYRLVEFDDAEDSIRVLAGDLPSGTLGVDKFWPAGFAIRLMDARPDVKLVMGSEPVDEARMIKDELELAAQLCSAHTADACVGKTIGMLKGGQTELEVSHMYAANARASGKTDGGYYMALVCFGANCAEPHHNSDHTTLGDGDAVIIDTGCSVRGYASDITRTVFFGRASDEQKRVYDLVLRANLAAIASTRPGTPLREIDRAARRIIEEAGYGQYFLHRTGHGIGLEGHEPPDVGLHSDAIAAPGMSFSIEPGIYLPGKFGVRIEDIVSVTEDGCLVLNELNKELTII